MSVGLFKDVLTNSVRTMSFVDMRTHLDSVCVRGLSEDIWPAWEIKRGLTRNPDLESLLVGFRSEHEIEPIVQAYEYHGLTSEEAAELSEMLRSFDELIGN